jgi:hypothetical protein
MKTTIGLVGSNASTTPRIEGLEGALRLTRRPA